MNTLFLIGDIKRHFNEVGKRTIRFNANRASKINREKAAQYIELIAKPYVELYKTLEIDDKPPEDIIEGMKGVVLKKTPKLDKSPNRTNADLYNLILKTYDYLESRKKYWKTKVQDAAVV